MNQNLDTGNIWRAWNDLTMPGGRSPSAEHPKLVIFIAESHTNSQIANARALSKELAAGRAPDEVCFFVEGEKFSRSPALSNEIGMRAIGLNREEVSALYWPLALASSVLDFCNIASAQGNPHYPHRDAILDEAEQRAKLSALVVGRPLATDRLMSIQQMVFTEMGHVVKFLGLTPQEGGALQEGILKMPDTLSGTINTPLVRLLKSVLERVNPKTVDEFNRLAQTSATASNRTITPLAWSAIERLKAACAAGKVEEAYAESAASFRATRENREFILAEPFITQPFKVAVANVGLNHASDMALKGILEAAGISVDVRISGIL